MKRIRVFYEEHKSTCNLVGAAAGVATVLVLASKMRAGGNGSRPTSVDLWQLDGGGASMIVVQTKNGMSHQFIREVTDPSIVVAS